jgi:hypothetical protein
MDNRPRLVRHPKSAAPQYPFVAPKPGLSGEPGERIAECIAAEARPRGNKWQLVLTFETQDAEIGRMWVELPKPPTSGSPFTSACRYMRLVRLALDREPGADAPVHPENVFKGRWFRVYVGYRKSTGAKGKGQLADDLANERKGEGDFLRVHDLLERVEAP